MDHPPAERPSWTEEKQPKFYEKDKGSAQIHGQIFEYKFCALVFLRATNKGYKFKLASNVKGLGTFDDVFVQYIDENCERSHNFVQLKSKIKHRITLQQLLAEKGDFSLRKYYQSYIQIEEKFNYNEEGFKSDCRIDERLFIIYTNADVGQELKSNKVLEFGKEFLMTGGYVLQFNEEEHKAIYQHLQELPRHREFLSRFRIFYSQADEKEMKFHIKRELQQSKNVPESELDLAYVCYRDFIKDWWQNCNYFLQDTNWKENDPLRKTSEKVRTTLVAKILDQRKSELDDLSIKYKQSAITDMQQLTEPHKAVLIFAPGRSTTLTAAKIHQMLSATKHIILNLQQFMRYKTEVMVAWKRTFNVLVIESDSSAEVSPDLFNELSGFLNYSVAEKKFIFISNSLVNIEQIHELRRTFHSKVTEEYDDCKFTDILTESRKLFLDKKVYFQGVEIKLSAIIKNGDFRVLNSLDCDSLSLLVENKKPSIGTAIEDTVECYIDRTLMCRKHAKTRFLAPDKIQHAFSGDILQKMPDISPHKDEDLGREAATFWKPSTLFESEGRVILVTDEPGLGKSTLLTHLARKTRKSHPDMWIVRVDVNNYTKILYELQTNGCDQKGAIKLLTQAAKIKKTDGVDLEGRLFNYTYNSTGNMAVLIDGVDEVSPHYTEEVVQVLKILSKTKIKKIWVTSRNSVKDRLETEFECQSFSLVPFSEEDQKRFLVTFWKKTCPQIKKDYLENLAKRIVELSTEHLTVQDKEFMGIPLQIWLLAEMFKGNLEECSTSTNVELPEYINVVILYDLYMKKKWDIYLSEKKFSDRTNVNVRTDDDDSLHKIFIHNHTAAALVAILSAYQLEKLTDKTIAERARDFLQKITEGMEKTGIIIDVIEGRPVFQHRTLAEYLVARWLCDNLQHGQTFMKDHLFESVFGVVRNMVDRILADKCPVHEAVLNSNMRQVGKLLNRKESITLKDRGGRTPLHVAISCRKPELIKLLLKQGAGVNSVDTLLGSSPVDYASRMNYWEILSLMMEKRPDIREQVLNGSNQDSTDCITSALRAAAQYGHNDLLEYLISEGNSVNVALPGDNSTLLHEAVRNGQTGTVKTLFQMGASIDCQDESGKTPLHVSVETGKLEVVKCIVEHQETVQREIELKHVVNPESNVKRGNFLNISDINGNTPLHFGVATGNINTVSYLISAGSDTNICNVQGDYPLTLAARRGKNDIVEILMEGELQCEEAQIRALRAGIVGGHVETTSLLIRLGAPVNKGENEKPIHIASQRGIKEIISLLLQNGACLISRTDSGNTALHLASEHGHLSSVKYLVELQRDGLYRLNYENETPLHLAARNGRDHLVTYFAEYGFNINTPSANGATCLHGSCENGHYTTVECLLKHGAEVNVMNSADQTPLHVAASRGQTKIIELLFLHNANFSLRDKEGITALLAASINGHQDTVQFIVQHGGNIEDTDGKGNTIAHFAVANENIDILNFLSQRNVSLDVKNSTGDTPLLKSVREGRNRLAQYLVERNSDINTQGNDGMWPLDISVLKGNVEITRILLERNAGSGKTSTRIAAAARFGFLDLLLRFVNVGDDVNVKADNGESPLHAACKSGQAATVQYLCEYGAILDWQDNNGNTALHVAVNNGHLEATQVLVEKGANMCAADISGSTVLHIAAKGGYLNIVQYLADSFAPIDKQNAKNETALLVAAAEGHEKIVSVLIEEGAGIGVRDIEGKTALDIATEKGYEIITQLLKDRAEGRILVCANSHTDIRSATEENIFEHPKKSLNGGVSIDTQTQEINTDTLRMFETTPEVTLDIQSIHRCALHTAAENNIFEEVQRLVEDGIALDYGDLFGRTALWVAAKRGHKLIIRYLLQNGSCVNIPDCEGVTPLEIAARKGHWEAVDVIRMYEPTISPEGSKYLRNMLHEASECGDIQKVQTILKCGISVETTNNYGCTPLHVSAKCGYQELSRMLLNVGANINVKDKYGRTPLVLSATNGHLDVVRELLNQGASVDIADIYGYTPLYAAAKYGHVEVVRVLRNHGASVHITDKSGFTPFYAAYQRRHVEVVQELLNDGAEMAGPGAVRFKNLDESPRLIAVLVLLLLLIIRAVMLLLMIVKLFVPYRT